ncbi:hypothetical protein X743_34710 [Mesorhizobium sp. LNHC252B00]|nr:hypothetical protein X743_34710 [Mesorhizobium sp. LNHC252B00]
MYVGRSYKLIDFALWSRRSVIYMVVVSGLAVAAYRLPGIAGFRSEEHTSASSTWWS